MLRKALKLAWKAHKGVDRDGPAPLPYAAHPFEVVSILRYQARVDDEEVLCAAALHDVLEDTAVSAEEIRKIWGDRVLALVREVTRYEPSEAETEGMSAEERWMLRSEILLAEIAGMSPDAQRIKLADRLSNVTAALATRDAVRLPRMLPQTESILAIIPRETCPPLWDRIRQLLDEEASPSQC